MVKQHELSVQDRHAIVRSLLQDTPEQQFSMEHGKVEGMHRQASTSKECAICWEDYTTKATLRVLRCGHVYHAACLEQWFVHQLRGSGLPAWIDKPPLLTCPFCRVPVGMR